MQHDVYFVAKLFVSVAKGGRDNNRNVQGVIQWHVFFLCAFLYLSYVKLYKVEVRTSFKPNTFGHKCLNDFIFVVIFLYWLRPYIFLLFSKRS